MKLKTSNLFFLLSWYQELPEDMVKMLDTEEIENIRDFVINKEEIEIKEVKHD